MTIFITDELVREIIEVLGLCECAADDVEKRKQTIIAILSSWIDDKETP